MAFFRSQRFSSAFILTVKAIVSLLRRYPYIWSFHANYQRATLVSEAQGYEVDQAEASELAKYHIHVLRQTLNTASKGPGHIVNVRGIGYRLMTD